MLNNTCITMAIFVAAGVAIGGTYDGFEVSPLGGATLDTSGGSLAVGPIGSSGQDGVSVDIGDLEDLKIVIDDPGAAAAGVPASWVVEATGVVDGSSGALAGRMRIDDVGGQYAIALDAAAAGVADCEIVVLLDGAHVATFPSPVGAQALVGVFPSVIGGGMQLSAVDDPGPCQPPTIDMYYCIGPGGHPCGIDWHFLSAALQACCDAHPNGYGIVHSCGVPCVNGVEFSDAQDITIGGGGGGGGVPGDTVVGDAILFVPSWDPNRLDGLETVEMRASGVGSFVIGGLHADTFIPACPGDVNGSGVVDFDDLNAVLGAWNTTDATGDADGSGFVDFDDLNLVLSNWGADCTSPGGGS